METQFTMYVDVKNEEILATAIRNVNKKTIISIKENIEKHSAEYQVFKRDGHKAWFHITVSRPFLIFKIAEEYTLCQFKVKDCGI